MKFFLKYFLKPPIYNMSEDKKAAGEEKNGEFFNFFSKPLKFPRIPPIYITSKANGRKFNAYPQCNPDLIRTIKDGLQ